MQTSFRITLASERDELDIASVNRSLHPDMQMEMRGRDLFVVVETSKEEDEEAHQLVRRELDRIYFFTAIRATAEMCSRTVRSDFPASYRILGLLPAELEAQDWNPIITLQLRLWSVADEITDSPTRLLILFQIIELTYPLKPNTPDYPKYESHHHAPERRTEAKLLRHLVTHAEHASRRETQLYVRYLGLESDLMANRSDPKWLRIVSEKVGLVRDEARDVIRAAILA